MDLKQAYKILDLPFGAPKEDIEQRYKKLSLKAHPDRGGTNNSFAQLSEAKAIALAYIDNKAVIVVANYFVSQELAAIQRENKINQEVNLIINKRHRNVRGKYQSLKDIVLVIALISGGLALLKSTPLFDFIEVNSTLYKMLGTIGILFGLFVALLTFWINRLKDRIDELKELFENKEEVFDVLVKIFGDTSNKKLRREEIYALIEMKCRTVSFDISDSGTSIEKFVRIIGHVDFGKILILKGVSNKLLEEIEFKKDKTYEIKYKLKNL